MSGTDSGGTRSAVPYSRYARVALPLPLHQTFSYGVTDRVSSVRVGSRVKVRLGARILVGCVVGLDEQEPALPPGTKLQPILAVLDDDPPLSSDQLSLARWLTDYYLAPPGEVLRALLPPETPRGEPVSFRRTPKGERRPPAGWKKGSLKARILAALDRPMTSRLLARKIGSRRLAPALRELVGEGYVERIEADGGRKPREVWAASVTPEGREALESATASEKLPPDGVRVLTLLATATDDVPLGTIRAELGLAQGPFRGLSRRGYIRLLKQPVVPEGPWSRLELSSLQPIELTPSQTTVCDDIAARLDRGEFSALVLHGVTGSGKTEIYLRAVERALAQARTALLLVPEIALTPRLAGLLHQRFRSQVAILHSGLGSGERRREWWRIRHKEARVVVGARAAVLAPIENVGLVVVDEEQEGSFKQEEAPRYNARDVAIKRAKDANAVVVLGSATPSLESFTHAVHGRYGLAHLPARIGDRPLADVELIDMKEVVREEGPDVILSRALREGIAHRLAEGEQALVLLNRRGYASQLMCRECGLAANCTECSVALTLHRGGTLAVCHYCGLGRPTPTRCDVCRGEYLKQQGFGTERIERVVAGTFDGIRVARMDRDTMRRKGSYENLLSRFANGGLDVLVGTQMLAKGHDFPAVTLVGVLAADVGLGVPDFRAAERTFQLLTQVAGRAGRGDRAGQVLIQTFSPDHYALRHARAQDFRGFYEEEMSFRRALRYPPAVSLVNLVLQGETMTEATQKARRVAEVLRGCGLPELEILGPAFAARSKVAGSHRCQVLVKTSRTQHRALRRQLRALATDPTLSRSLTIDIDPVTLH